MRYRLLILLFVILQSAAQASPADRLLQQVFDSFILDFKALKVPEFGYSYQENFQNIQDLRGIKRQAQFFYRYKTKLTGIPRSELSRENRYDYDALLYEIGFNLERLALEKKWRTTLPAPSLPEGGLFFAPRKSRLVFPLSEALGLDPNHPRCRLPLRPQGSRAGDD